MYMKINFTGGILWQKNNSHFKYQCNALPDVVTAPELRYGLYEAFKAALPHASSLQPTSLLGRLKGVDTPACAHFAYAREPLLSSRR